MDGCFASLVEQVTAGMGHLPTAEENKVWEWRIHKKESWEGKGKQGSAPRKLLAERIGRIPAKYKRRKELWRHKVLDMDPCYDGITSSCTVDLWWDGFRERVWSWRLEECLVGEVALEMRITGLGELHVN